MDIKEDDFVLVEMDPPDLSTTILDKSKVVNSADALEVKNNRSTLTTIFNTAKNIKYIVEKTIGNVHRIYLVYYIGSKLYSYRFWIYGLVKLVLY